MKKVAIVFLLLIYLAINGIAQNTKVESKNLKELNNVLTTFMECLKNKDQEKFYSLFHEDPIVWIGIYKEKSQQTRTKTDSSIKDYKTGNYKTFFQSVLKGNVEEKFYNSVIEEDGYVASITFDYSFWANGKKGNWGKESWGLIKTGGKWKITSVIYSIEFERIETEPDRTNKKEMLGL